MGSEGLLKKIIRATSCQEFVLNSAELDALAFSPWLCLLRACIDEHSGLVFQVLHRPRFNTFLQQARGSAAQMMQAIEHAGGAQMMQAIQQAGAAAAQMMPNIQ